MRDLIERLEKLTGLSRELDADIHEEVAQVRIRENYPDNPPHYTGSIDAALTLVPKGLLVSITIGFGQAVAYARTGSLINPDTKEFGGPATTPRHPPLHCGSQGSHGWGIRPGR